MNFLRLVSLAFALSCTAALTAGELDYARDVKPLLEQNCFKCHNETKQKGGINLARFTDTTSVLRQPKLWRSVFAEVQSGEMPPEDEPALPKDTRSRIEAHVQAFLTMLESDAIRDPGPPLLRRLTRAEYNLTIRDLTGLEFSAEEACGMPDDTPVSGFAAYVSGQDVTVPLLEKYFAAADKIVERFTAALDPAKKNSKDRAALNKLFDGLPGTLPERDAAKTFVARVARRAFRRPVSVEDVERLLKFYDQAAAKKEPFQNAVLATLKPILVSMSFLFRVEQDRPEKGAYLVSDVELATRWSYFLWSCPPDEELLGAAESGKLADPAVRAAQLKRLLASPKARALTDNFAAFWLQYRRVYEARPSTEFYPAFNRKLRESMANETATFFDKLREEDRRVLELLDADYTYVNEPLAKLYGIDGVTGDALRRVSLTPAQHRGGLLGMGSILALTSHTNRTSPTQRGKWVLEVLLNNPPANPPANAGQFKDEAKNKHQPKDFREKLAMHATDPTCAGCHKKIDPLGFGLENFDGIGAWRESGNGVDATGELPGGKKFNGVAELKQIVLAHKDDFERGLSAKLLSYAIGRELDFYDEPELAKIKAALNAGGHRFSVLIEAIANSYAMRYRRNAE